MFKIQNRLVPQYLYNQCPPIVGDIVGYNLRNQDNIHLPRLRTESYRKSCIPSSIRLWNSLAPNIKGATSLQGFKKLINKFPCYKTNKLFSSQIGRSSIYHTRIRLGLSGLNAHRYNYDLIEFSHCPNCGHFWEDEIHFLIDCPAYGNARTALLEGLHQLPLNTNAISYREKKQLASTLLNGASYLDFELNCNIFEFVKSFISLTLRFT